MPAHDPSLRSKPLQVGSGRPQPTQRQVTPPSVAVPFQVAGLGTAEAVALLVPATVACSTFPQDGAPPVLVAEVQVVTRSPTA